MTAVFCPVCRTLLSIPIEILGKPVLCTACSTRFIPDAPALPPLPPHPSAPADAFDFDPPKPAHSASDDDGLSNLEVRRLIAPAIRWLRMSAGFLFVFWVLCCCLAFVLVAALLSGRSSNHWGFSVPVVLLVILVGSALVVLLTGARKLDRRQGAGWVWAAGITSIVLSPVLLLIGVGGGFLSFFPRAGVRRVGDWYLYGVFGVMGLSVVCLVTGLKTLNVLRDRDVIDALSRK